MLPPPAVAPPRKLYRPVLRAGLQRLQRRSSWDATPPRTALSSSGTSDGAHRTEMSTSRSDSLDHAANASDLGFLSVPECIRQRAPDLDSRPLDNWGQIAFGHVTFNSRQSRAPPFILVHLPPRIAGWRSRRA